MKNIKSIALFSISGIGIGVPITLICMFLIGGFNSALLEFFTWTLASAMYGIISGLIFNKKSNLNLPVSLLLHCIGCLIVTAVACVICGYVDNFIEFVLSIIPIFIFVYLVIQIIFFINMKIDEKKINKTLNK